MEDLALPHAKLFYCIYQLSESGQITAHEKDQLKEMVTLEHAGLFEVIAKHEDDPELLNEILKLVRHGTRKKPENIVPSRAYGDEVSSPLGTFLLNKKKRQHADHELHFTLIDSMDPEPTVGDFKLSLMGADSQPPEE